MKVESVINSQEETVGYYVTGLVSLKEFIAEAKRLWVEEDGDPEQVEKLTTLDCFFEYWVKRPAKSDPFDEQFLLARRETPDAFLVAVVWVDKFRLRTIEHWAEEQAVKRTADLLNEHPKHCPFCGPGQSKVSAYQDCSGYWRVGCGACGSSSGIRPASEADARTRVIASWNRRPMEEIA